MFAPYLAGSGFAHRLSPGTKLVALALIGTALFLVEQPAVGVLAALVALLLYPLARLPLSEALAQLRPLALPGALIVAVQVFVAGPGEALLVGARLVALLLLAGVVSLTTRTSAMIETLERALAPFARLGVNPRKVALALSLGVRLVPLLAQITREVREAQALRGLENNLMALAVPVLARALALTDTLADAIEARAFDPAPQDEAP